MLGTPTFGRTTTATFLLCTLIILAGCGSPRGHPAPPPEAEAQRFVDEMLAALARQDETWMARHATPRYYYAEGEVTYLEALNQDARREFAAGNARCSRTLERFSIEPSGEPKEPAVVHVSSRLACGERTYGEAMRVEWRNGMMGDLQPMIAEVRRSKTR